MEKNMTKEDYIKLIESMVQLDTQLEEHNRRLAELYTRKKELAAEIQTCREKAISTQIHLINKLFENTRLMIEMGIDPTSIPMKDAAACTDILPVHDTEIENKDIDSFNSLDGIATEDVAEHKIEAVETCSTLDTEELDNFSEREEVEAEFTEAMKPDGKLLTPFYQIWGLRKGEFPKTCPGPEWKHNSPRLHIPFEALCKGSVNKCMNMGNLKYRESCAIPTESRIFSADGIAPTLVRMHSDIMVRIGNNPHSLTAA